MASLQEEEEEGEIPQDEKEEAHGRPLSGVGGPPSPPPGALQRQPSVHDGVQRLVILVDHEKRVARLSVG